MKAGQKWGFPFFKFLGVFPLRGPSEAARASHRALETCSVRVLVAGSAWLSQGLSVAARLAE